MLEYLKQEANHTFTENGAVTYASTGSDCLDLFATIGALRTEAEQEIIDRFIRAYAEQADIAMKLLFFARDVRGGLGERRVFRTILAWLGDHRPDSVKKNIKYVAEYGRYDDLLSLMGTACEKDMLFYLKMQFDADMEAMREDQRVSLLGKWLPSVNTSSPMAVRNAKRIAKAFGMNDAAYRKSLSALRREIQIIENNLRAGDYSFDYEKQPSRALYKYRKAFIRNDKERYSAFISKASSGEAVLHADHIAPYELVEPYLEKRWEWLRRELSQEEREAINTTWNALPDFGGDENALAVIDTSGSMYGMCGRKKPLPAAVALSLGLYFAEHNKGIFANHFIEFSARPQLIQIKGETFADRLQYVSTFAEVANTNLEAVFDLVLDTAVKNQVPRKDLPERLVIISDMEFDCCMENASAANFDHAREKFASHGYRLPGVVFWNVASRHRQQPVTKNEQGVILVSGTTPGIFEMTAGGDLDPFAFMMEVVNGERYARITA